MNHAIVRTTGARACVVLSVHTVSQHGWLYAMFLT